MRHAGSNVAAMVARRKTLRGQRWCARTDCAVAMIVGALAGCSGGGGLPAFDGESPSAARSPVVASDAAISSPTAAAGPLMAFIAGAGDGQTAELDDPSFGGG